MSTFTTRTVPTSQLLVGDEVLIHGMVVRLVAPRGQFEGSNGTVYLWKDAQIIGGQAPAPWEDSKTWDIQGNDKALWSVRQASERTSLMSTPPPTFPYMEGKGHVFPEG